MILIAFGTRPEIIKLFPVIREARKQRIAFKTVFTGQHLDLYKDVKDLVPEPDFVLDSHRVMPSKESSLGHSFTRICQDADKLFSKNKFTFVVVQGDTTTAWAIAQMAFFHKTRIAHVEAGLRTFDLHNPYPEEANRTLITELADLHFAPTQIAYSYLKKRGKQGVYFVGNTIVDAVKYFHDKLQLGSIKTSKKVLITLHRRENHSRMAKIFALIQDVASQNPDLIFVFPIHPNPNVRKHQGILQASNIKIIAPLPYPKMLRLLSQSVFIITDSGGIQEEATCLNKKVLIVREKTERQETIDIGLGRLVGLDIAKHIKWAREPNEKKIISPYGKGDASRKIIQILIEKSVQNS